MIIYHSKNLTQADGGDASLVRPSDWNSAHSIAQQISGNTSGSSQVVGTNIVWQGGDNITLGASTAAGAATIEINGPGQSYLLAGNNITLSTNGSSISVIGPSPGTGVTMHRWVPGNAKNASSLGSHNATSLNGTSFLQHVNVENYVSGTKIGQVLGLTAQTSHNSSNVLTISQKFGIYTRGAQSDTQLSLASSGSTTFAATWSSSTTTGAFNLRELYCPMDINMTPGEYFICNGISVSATNGGSAASFSRFGIPIQSAGGGAADGFGVNTNVTNGAFFPGQGALSFTSAALPNTIGLNQVTQTGTALMYANQIFEIVG